MMTSRIQSSGANALRDGRPLQVSLEATSSADPMAIYDLLADLQSHLEWAGRRQRAQTRLLTLDAPPGPAVAGTEFSTTGTDPMGSFADQSVVTEATPGRIFEFVTEAVLTPKGGGRPIEWTIVHRYEIAPRPGGGSRVVYGLQITRISHLPGLLRVLRTPLAPLAMKASAALAQRGLRNLIAIAEERSQP